MVRPGSLRDGFETALDGYFGIKFPQGVPASEQYEFNWGVLEGSSRPLGSLTTTQYKRAPLAEAPFLVA